MREVVEARRLPVSDNLRLTATAIGCLILLSCIGLGISFIYSILSY